MANIWLVVFIAVFAAPIDTLTREVSTPGLYLRNVYDDLYSGVSDEFDKGHLNPFAINSFREDYAKSTFVYSNAVPQYSQWNRGAWKEYEKAIRHYTQMTCGCRHRGKMYLMTGTSKSNVRGTIFGLELETESQRTPYDIIDSEEEKTQIEVPKALWTAGCCVWESFDKENAQSIAVMGNNTPYKGKDETMGITLKNLEELLGADVNLFPGVPACRQNPVLIRVDYVDRKKSTGRKSRGYRDN